MSTPKWFGNFALLILLLLFVIFIFSQLYQCYSNYPFSFQYFRFLSRASGCFVFALLRPFGYVNIANEPLTHLLLYGDKDLPDDLNKNILKLTPEFIHETGRFD